MNEDRANPFHNGMSATSSPTKRIKKAFAIIEQVIAFAEQNADHRPWYLEKPGQFDGFGFPDCYRLGLDIGEPVELDVEFKIYPDRISPWVDEEHHPEVHPIPELTLPPDLDRRLRVLLERFIKQEIEQRKKDYPWRYQ